MKQTVWCPVWAQIKWLSLYNFVSTWKTTDHIFLALRSSVPSLWNKNIYYFYFFRICKILNNSVNSSDKNVRATPATWFLFELHRNSYSSINIALSIKDEKKNVNHWVLGPYKRVGDMLYIIYVQCTQISRQKKCIFLSFSLKSYISPVFKRFFELIPWSIKYDAHQHNISLHQLSTNITVHSH